MSCLIVSCRDCDWQEDTNVIPQKCPKCNSIWLHAVSDEEPEQEEFLEEMEHSREEEE